MIKKLLCILLSVVLVFSLAACAKDKTEDKDDAGKQFGDTITDVEDNTEDNGEDEAAVKELQKKFKGIWELKDDVTHSYKDIVVGTKNVNDVEITTITTELPKFDIKSTLTKLKDNKYLSNIYEDFYDYKSERHTISYDEGKQDYTLTEDTYSIYSYTADPHFSFSVGQTRHHYQTPEYFGVTMEFKSINDVNQTEIYNFLKDFAPDFAEYLVYGKDITSGEEGSYDTIWDYNMEERFKVSEDTSYSLTRGITCESFGKVRITFAVNFSTSVYGDVYDNDLIDETDFYVESDYTFSNIIADKYPDFNPTNHKDFTDMFVKEYMPGTKYSYVENWDASEYTDAEGALITTQSITIDFRNDEDDSIGKFEIDTETTLKDNKFDYGVISVTVDTRKPILETEELVAKEFEKKFKDLFGEFKITENTDDEDHEVDVEATVNGHKYSGSMEIDHDKDAAYKTVHLSISRSYDD